MRPIDVDAVLARMQAGMVMRKTHCMKKEENMRLIDADMLRDKLKEIAHDRFNLSDEYGWFLKGLLAADDEIRLFPDAIEIIRCKDCRYFEESRNGWGRCTRAVEILIHETDFCSFGEKGDKE